MDHTPGVYADGSAGCNLPQKIVPSDLTCVLVL